MCGIAGTVSRKYSDFSKIVSHQTKRGPDFTGEYLHRPYDFGEHNVYLGHNRLSILDLSENGNQPMSTSRYHLTYNGEIYNYREMQSYLNSDDDLGNCNPIGNDAKVLLHYISKFGIEKALQDANGMYAYCCFDADLMQIHLIVDRFGQKPLYYFHNHTTFAFASSVGALMQLKDKWKINEEGLQSYWLLGSTMGEDSMIYGIKRLTGSQHLIYDIEKNSVKIERYWTPKFIENASGIEDLILDAIRKTMVADVPVYVFLSGGIDSTLVASQCKGMNAVHLGEKEYPYAKQVADKFGMNLIQVNPDDSDVMTSLQDYAFQSGEPSMAALIPYLTAKETSKYAKVAISANGADELFFGYDRMLSAENQAYGIFRKSAFRFECNQYYPRLIDPGWQQWVELQTYVQYDLNKTLDAASMCHSLEVRSPFLDHRLVEMALSIPEVVHRKQGNKTILKNMLRKMGFDDKFMNRPKLGFSLHREPPGMEELKTEAWKFVKENGFLKCDDSKLNGRDERYLKMSALSFYAWYKTWESKL